eukprot:TRINITY_DN7477_c0_g3_i1.p1 TRINITY_DN7477_c0_g3~~TRINITY_DN7477_c0_g3_i1.p1  ORF type:complete len:1044 (+),score=109.50 TRINITY_DN7477_c0_g3_i1:50-3181(+)
MQPWAVVVFFFDPVLVACNDNTWRQVIATGDVPSPRQFMSAAYAVDHKKIYAFGGGDSCCMSKQNHGELLEYDVLTESWTHVSVANRPMNRHAYGMSFVPPGFICIFGGFTALGFYDDMHIYNITSNRFMNLSKSEGPGKPTGGGPQRLAFSAMVYATTANDGRLFVFGGLREVWGASGPTQHYSNAFWSYSIQNNHWSQIAAGGTPSARLGHAMVHVNSEGVEYIFVIGGKGESFYLNDVHAYNLRDGTWALRTPSGVGSPSPRWGHAISCIPYQGEDQIVIFGGKAKDKGTGLTEFKNDLWAYSVLYNSWTYMVATNAHPSVRGFMAFTRIPHDGEIQDQIFVIAGSDGTSNKPDVMYSYAVPIPTTTTSTTHTSITESTTSSTMDSDTTTSFSATSPTTTSITTTITSSSLSTGSSSSTSATLSRTTATSASTTFTTSTLTRTAVMATVTATETQTSFVSVTSSYTASTTGTTIIATTFMTRTFVTSTSITRTNSFSSMLQAWSSTMPTASPRNTLSPTLSNSTSASSSRSTLSTIMHTSSTLDTSNSTSSTTTSETTVNTSRSILPLKLTSFTATRIFRSVSGTATLTTSGTIDIRAGNPAATAAPITARSNTSTRTTSSTSTFLGSATVNISFPEPAVVTTSSLLISTMAVSSSTHSMVTWPASSLALNTTSTAANTSASTASSLPALTRSSAVGTLTSQISARRTISNASSSSTATVWRASDLGLASESSAGATLSTSSVARTSSSRFIMPIRNTISTSAPITNISSEGVGIGFPTASRTSTVSIVFSAPRIDYTTTSTTCCSRASRESELAELRDGSMPENESTTSQPGALNWSSILLSKLSQFDANESSEQASVDEPSDKPLFSSAMDIALFSVGSSLFCCGCCGCLCRALQLRNRMPVQDNFDAMIPKKSDRSKDGVRPNSSDSRRRSPRRNLEANGDENSPNMARNSVFPTLLTNTAGIREGSMLFTFVKRRFSTLSQEPGGVHPSNGRDSEQQTVNRHETFALPSKDTKQRRSVWNALRQMRTALPLSSRRA